MPRTADQLRPYMWQKGKSGNPLGKAKDLLTIDQVKILTQRMCKMTKAELQAVIQDDKSTMIECMIAGIMVKTVALGDPMRLEFLLSRTFGKVKEEVHQTVNYHPSLDREPKENILKVLRDLRGPKTTVIDADVGTPSTPKYTDPGDALRAAMRGKKL